MVDAGLVGTRQSRSKPEIPVEVTGDRIGTLGAVDSLGPDGTVGPDMQFEGLADGPGVNHFHSAAQSLVGAALVAHLGGQFLFASQIAHDAGFPDSLGERLLHVGMLAHGHGGDGGHAMAVVGSGDCDGIDLVFHLLQQFPEVLVLLGLGKLLGLPVHRVAIDVAEGHDLAPFAGGVVGVTAALAPGADTGHADLGVQVLSAHDGREPENGTSGDTGVFDKFTASELLHDLGDECRGTGEGGKRNFGFKR
ncbi:MAG: hypothetical protein QGH41_00335 [Roseibacillus sp.]|nr:hypothetical protein [Roseibacillus sp.]